MLLLWLLGVVGLAADIDDTALSDEMLLQTVKAVRAKHRLDTSYDIPYLAGYSRDGKTIYIHRGLPNGKFKSKDGKTHEAWDFLYLHEVVEKSLLMSSGIRYQEAHQVALRAEKAAVLAAGVSWKAYDDFMAKHIAVARNEHRRIPADLDLQPYVDEKDSELLIKMKANLAE